jgi:hypothetical protein
MDDDFPLGTPEERAQIAGLPAQAFPADVAVMVSVPASTLEKLNSQGRGPRLFKIGRRRFTTPEFVRKWLDDLAKEDAEQTQEQIRSKAKSAKKVS